MARRRRKTKTRRSRRQTSIKILGVAEGLAIGNLATNAVFNVNLAEFFTGTVAGKVGGMSNDITLKELWTGAMGGSTGVANKLGLMGTMQANLQRVEWSQWLQLITIPIAFRVGRKLLGPRVINPVNRILKNQLGIKEIKL